jgi:hypothetical protein
VLEAMAAFVATEKLVRKTNVTTHAANGLMIHHFLWCALLEYRITELFM